MGIIWRVFGSKMVTLQQNVDIETNPTGLVIIQPTPFCNLNCTYCYLPNRLDTRRMAWRTLDALVAFLADVPFLKSPLSVVWHAGEPLVVPIEFYREAFSRFSLITKRGITVHQSIQTNATLITDDWCRFFLDHQVHVGVSVDGPKELHDSSRRDWRGNGTFERTIKGVELLQKWNIPFSVIAVLPFASLGHPDAIWNFFVDHGMTNLNFNPEEAEGANVVSSLNRPETDDLYEQFLVRILELSSKRDDVTIRELEEAAQPLLTVPGTVMRSSESAIGSILNFDVEGNVSTFSPELLTTKHEKYGPFTFGNVHTHSYAQFVETVSGSVAAADITLGIENCKNSCEYFSVCGGGSPSNKLIELGTFAGTETSNCRLRVKAATRVLLKHLETELAL